MLNTPIRNKSILEFKTKMEVLEILNLADGLDEDAYEGIYEQWISFFTVLFSLYHLSSPSSLISLMFFDGRASSRLA